MSTLKVINLVNPSSSINMVLSAGGNVGIGTTTTSYTLDVTGNLRITGNSILAGNITSNVNVTGTYFNVAATGARITGDFSNATVANRANFQTSTTNGATYVSTLPLGTGTASGFFSYNAADGDNASFIGTYLTSAVSIINSGKNGTGTYLPLTFYTNAAERMRVLTNGNVGIGSSAPITTLDVAGNVNVTNTVVMGSSFLRNRIINGATQIWQRNTTFTFSAGAITTANYTADRWMCYSGGSQPTITVTRSTDVPTGYQYSLRNQRNSGATATGAVYTVQFIESVNCYDLSGQVVTLSYWAKAGANFSAASSQLGISVITGTAADQGYTTLAGAGWTGQANPLLVNQTITTSWARYSHTFTVGAGVLEMVVILYNNTTGTAGADDSYYIAGVQLEPGPVMTPFERRQFTNEFQLCQRYYCQSYAYGTVAGTATFAGANGASNYSASFNGTATVTLTWPVEMRIAPTVTSYSPFNGVSGQSSSTTTNYANNSATVGTRQGYISAQASGGANTQQFYHWTAVAEL